MDELLCQFWAVRLAARPFDEPSIDPVLALLVGQLIAPVEEELRAHEADAIAARGIKSVVSSRCSRYV